LISYILEKIHNLIHCLKLPRSFDFWFMCIKIKWDNKNSKCWKCKHFDGFYFDEYTYDCKLMGTCVWGDEDSCEVEKVELNEKI